MTGTPDPESFLPLPNLPLHILLALSSGETLHGWAVIKRIGEIAGAAACPSTGSLYLAMVRLSERGLLEEVPSPSADADSRRKHYRITSLARRVVAAETSRLARLVEVARAADLSDNRK